MLTALLPALVALVGLVIYVLASNPKAAEIGRIMFGAGLLVVCLVLAGRMVRLL